MDLERGLKALGDRKRFQFNEEAPAFCVVTTREGSALLGSSGARNAAQPATVACPVYVRVHANIHMRIDDIRQWSVF